MIYSFFRLKATMRPAMLLTSLRASPSSLAALKLSTNARLPKALLPPLSRFAVSAGKPHQFSTSPSFLPFAPKNVSILHSNHRMLMAAQQFAARNPQIARLATDSSKSSSDEPTPKYVAYWLFATAALVYGIVVLGGVTRLTESGLSITEWNLIRGMKWPSSEEEWEVEWRKYRETPEYKL